MGQCSGVCGRRENWGMPKELEVFSVRCSQRCPTSLTLEWSASAQYVTNCELQVLKNGWWERWETPVFEKLGEPRCMLGGTWQATLAELAPATAYGVQISGSDGLRRGEWHQQQFSTSSAPATPTSIVQLARLPDGVCLEWEVADPEGAKVTACDVQIMTTFSWASAAFSPSGEPYRRAANSSLWRATVCNLSPNAIWTIRVCAENSVGHSPWSDVQEFKTSESPKAPQSLQCVRRLPDMLVLRWCLADPEGAEITACDVQICGSLSWANAVFEGGASPTRTEGKHWQATVASLVGDTAYNIRVRGCSAAGEGEWSPLTCRTSDRPPEAAEIQCVERRATSLRVEWQLPDPEGAEVQSCELWLAGTVSWQPLATEPGSEPRRAQGNTWEVAIHGLTAATNYDLRLCGRNVVGTGPLAKQDMRTSELPPEATSFDCLERTPHELTLEWRVEDPQGAEVNNCELQVAGSLSWASAAFSSGPNAEPRRCQGDLWRASIAGLLGNTTYEVRVRGRNDGGDGSWCQRTFRTSELPQEPSAMACIQRLPDGLHIEWLVHDPDGAEVTSCQVQVSGALSWAPAELGNGGQATRTAPGSCKWQAWLDNLAGATIYELRVCGCNASGQGRWSEPRQFKTCDVPAEPTHLCCSQRIHDGFRLEWHLDDPDGAVVAGCQIQVGTGLSWSAAMLVEEQGETMRRKGDTWQATVMNLSGATQYQVRVCGRNASGIGPWSRVQQFQTSDVPQEPTNIHICKRLPDKLLLEWEIQDPEGAAVSGCEVQIRGTLGWSLAMFEAGVLPERVHGACTWRATVVGLTGATPYDISIRGRNASGDGKWSPQLQFRTSDLPAVPSHFACVKRLPRELALEWQVDDPEGSDVLRCELQVGGSVSWGAAAFLEGAEPKRCRPELGEWTATLGSLMGGMQYEVRVRAINASGEGPWIQQSFRTCDVPAVPQGLRRVTCLPDKLPLEWYLGHVEGTETTRCDVQIQGAVSWSDAVLEAADQPRLVEKDLWNATIVGLSGATAYMIRVRGCNLAGNGQWVQQQLRTASVPPAPTDLDCLHQAPKKLVLQWRVDDPDGAGVADCEVQLQGALMWENAVFEPAEASKRTGDNVWQATIISLSPDSSHTVRVRGCNAAGQGAWSEQRRFHTIIGTPDAPQDVHWKCVGQGRLELQWRVSDPEGVPVTSCSVRQLIKPSIAAPYWEAAQLENGKAPWRLEEASNLWQANIVGLSADTSYIFSVYASNDQGDGRWLRKEVCTLRVPEAPVHFECTECLHDRLSLEWQITDPEGAAVLSCDLQMSGTLFWQPAVVSAVPCRREGTDVWQAIVMGLSEDCSYEFRVCGRNAVGEGVWSQHRFTTGLRP